MKRHNRKLITLVFALILSVSPELIKAQYFNVGDKDINFGLGIGSTLYTGIGTYGKIGIPPVSASFDYGFKDEYGPGVIGLGGYIGYSSYKYEYTIAGLTEGWKSSVFVIGARGTYHMEIIDNLDTYGGLMLYYRNYSYKDIGSGYTGSYGGSSGLMGGLFAGGKYYFKDNLAAFAELGYSIAWITLGLSMKLE